MTIEDYEQDLADYPYLRRRRRVRLTGFPAIGTLLGVWSYHPRHGTVYRVRVEVYYGTEPELQNWQPEEWLLYAKEFVGL